MNGTLWASYVLLWLVVLALAAAVLALYHHFGQMYLTSRDGRQNQGPALEQQLKPARSTDLVGKPVVMPNPGRPQLLIFTMTDCRVCSGLREDIAGFARVHPEVETVIICGDEPALVHDWAGEMTQSGRVVADPTGRLAAIYHVGLVPYMVGLDGAGRVQRKGLVNDRAGLEWATEQNSGKRPIFVANEGGTRV